MGGAYHVSWGGVLIPFAFTSFLKYYNQRGAQTNWNSTGACRGGLDIWHLTNILISVDDEDEGRESRRAGSPTREEKDAADEIREARICPLTSMGTLYGCDGGRGANTREMEEAASRSTQIQVYTGDVDKKYHCFFCQTHQRRVSKAGQDCHIIFTVMDGFERYYLQGRLVGNPSPSASPLCWRGGIHPRSRSGSGPGGGSTMIPPPPTPRAVLRHAGTANRTHCPLKRRVHPGKCRLTGWGSNPIFSPTENKKWAMRKFATLGCRDWIYGIYGIVALLSGGDRRY